MGTRCKCSRPRRDRDETDTLASPAETRPRRDVLCSSRDVIETLKYECYFRRKSAILRFYPHKGGLEATYNDHLRLIGKRVVDFLLVLIDFFR